MYPPPVDADEKHNVAKAGTDHGGPKNGSTAEQNGSGKSDGVEADKNGADSSDDESDESSSSPAVRTTIPCPFAWCRPVKHLLYHLISCTAGRSCRICHPRAISDNMATLTSLNAHRRNKRKRVVSDVASSIKEESPAGAVSAESKPSGQAGAPNPTIAAATSAAATGLSSAFSTTGSDGGGGHPGNPTVANEELLTTSESFSLPETFPSLLAGLSSINLTAEVDQDVVGTTLTSQLLHVDATLSMSDLLPLSNSTSADSTTVDASSTIPVSSIDATQKEEQPHPEICTSGTFANPQCDPAPVEIAKSAAASPSQTPLLSSSDEMLTGDGGTTSKMEETI